MARLVAVIVTWHLCGGSAYEYFFATLSELPLEKEAPRRLGELCMRVWALAVPWIVVEAMSAQSARRRPGRLFLVCDDNPSFFCR